MLLKEVLTWAIFEDHDQLMSTRSIVTLINLDYARMLQLLHRLYFKVGFVNVNTVCNLLSGKKLLSFLVSYEHNSAHATFSQQSDLPILRLVLLKW